MRAAPAALEYSVPTARLERRFDRLEAHPNDRDDGDDEDRRSPLAGSFLYAFGGALRADHARRTARAASARGRDHASERREAVVQVRGRLGDLRAASRARQL